MNGVTHMLGGVALSTAASIAFPSYFGVISPVTVVAGLFGGLIPDIDHPKSKISNMTLATKIVSNAITATTSHRGVCHSLLFIGLVSFLFQTFAVKYISFITPSVIWWLTAGMLSHLVLDMMNPTGVNLFWPFGKKHHFMKIKTGSSGEKVVSFILMVIDVILLVQAGLMKLEV